MSQLGCPSGSADRTGAPDGWRQDSPTRPSVGGWRASWLLVGWSLVWARATVVMAARFMAASVAPRRTVRASLDWLAPIDQLAHCGRPAGCSAAPAGHRTSCHQPRPVHRLRRRGGRAPLASRAWAACSRRSVMCCSARTWLSPACWLCMCPSLPAAPPACSAAGSSMVVAGQLRMVLRCRLRIRQVPYAGALPRPIFGR
jgi:hypothetical protein